jgi:energy-converting hydrogenase Eha subunit F
MEIYCMTMLRGCLIVSTMLRGVLDFIVFFFWGLNLGVNTSLVLVCLIMMMKVMT